MIFVRPSKTWKPFVHGHYGVAWRWVRRMNKRRVRIAAGRA